jgi:ATP-dependent helicase HepA
VLRGKIWTPVLEELPTWTRLCRDSADVAWEEIRGSERLATAVQEGLDSAERETARRLAILEARALRFPSGTERKAAHEELSVERRAAGALARGIQNPSIRMVASGACVLWPEDNF